MSGLSVSPRRRGNHGLTLTLTLPLTLTRTLTRTLALALTLTLTLTLTRPPFSPVFATAAAEAAKVPLNAHSFPEEMFGSVSEEAKAAINAMLVVDPRRRPSAAELLHHPWLAAPEAEPTLPMEVAGGSPAGSERGALSLTTLNPYPNPNPNPNPP